MACGRRVAPGPATASTPGGRWVFWTVAGWLALAFVVAPALGLPTFEFITDGQLRLAAGPGYHPLATFERLVPIIKPWSPLEVYYYPLAFLDFAASTWRVLFVAILAVLPPQGDVLAPWLWGFYIALMLAGLWVGSGSGRDVHAGGASRRAAARGQGRLTRRRLAWRAGLGLLGAWLVLCLVALAVGNAASARAAREAELAELNRLEEAVAQMSETFDVLAAALPAYRDATGTFPVREGRIDWEGLRREAGADLRLARGPEAAEFVLDATPTGTPLPPEAGPLVGTCLETLLSQSARAGWAPVPWADLVYLEWASASSFTVVLVPASERAREARGPDAWLLTEEGPCKVPLGRVTPVIERIGADHAALALEDLARVLVPAMNAYLATAGGYPVDAAGNLSWLSLYEKTALSHESLEAIARRTSGVVVAVPPNGAGYPYLQGAIVGPIEPPGPEVDLIHTSSFSANSFSLVFRPSSERMRLAMGHLAGEETAGVDLVITPEGFVYGRSEPASRPGG